MIINHVDLIRNLVNEFSAFARFPAADPKPCQLTRSSKKPSHCIKKVTRTSTFKSTSRCAAGDESGSPADQTGDDQSGGQRRFGRPPASGTICIVGSHDPILKSVRIEVTDDGTGISDDDKSRLFEPNFRPKKQAWGWVDDRQQHYQRPWRHDQCSGQSSPWR
jgi:two-component system, NtrC family, nitrogen regulation sensor histidine kinase NtrY